MAVNPMQRKARNSMLLGAIIGLLIGAVIIVPLFMQLNKLQQEKKKQQEASIMVYVLTSDIKSGTNIDISNLLQKQVAKDMVPSDAVTSDAITENTIAKVDITKGTVLAKALIEDEEQKTTADVREQQYNMIVLPQYLQIDDYVDIRLTLPTGQDYIVVPKKRIKDATEDTIWINMAEEEILTMSNAIVEAYIMKGSKLYATKYVEPGLQTTATTTYPVNKEVLELINVDPNIVETAKQKLGNRYRIEQRNGAINGAVNSYNEQRQDNIEAGLEDEVTRSKEARKKYLDALNGVN